MGFKILIIINLIVFLIYGLDKYLATRNRSRISEKFLLIAAFFLGSIGAFGAMIVFRHKISKTSFLWKFGLVVVIQLIVFYLMMNVIKN